MTTETIESLKAELVAVRRELCATQKMHLGALTKRLVEAYNKHTHTHGAPGPTELPQLQALAETSYEAVVGENRAEKLQEESDSFRALLRQWLEETNHIPELRTVYRETMNALMGDFLKRAILSCNRCSDPLKQGEMMICKQCDELMNLASVAYEHGWKGEKNESPKDFFVAALTGSDAQEVKRLTGCLKRANSNMETVERELYLKLNEAEEVIEKLRAGGRVVNARPSPGRQREFPDMRVTGVDYALEGSERTVLVIRLALAETPEAMQRIGKHMREKLGDSVVIFFTRDGIELTVLDLPKQRIE